MLKRVVAIFDATQKVCLSPGTLAGDGDLGDLEGIRLGSRGQSRNEQILSALLRESENRHITREMLSTGLPRSFRGRACERHS
jgi:hypothetical protein